MQRALALALLLLASASARAGDAAKRDCRAGCQEALRSCKEDCAPERDSGDLWTCPVSANT